MDDGWESEPWTCDEGNLSPDPLDPLDGRIDIDGDGLTSLQEYQLLKIEGDYVVRSAQIPVEPIQTMTVSLMVSKCGQIIVTVHPMPITQIPMAMASWMAQRSNQDGSWDPDQETDPLSKDTDGDGVPDGIEDADQDGRQDPMKAIP